jgi:hypothetical protein
MTMAGVPQPPGEGPGSAAPRRRYHTSALLLPVIGAGVVGYFVSRVGLDPLAQAFRQAGWGMVPLLLAPLFLFTMHAIGWSFTLSRENRRAVGLPRLVALQTFSYGISGIVPLQVFLAEPLKLAFLRGTDVDTEDFAGSLLIDNTINGISIFLVSASGMLYLAFFMMAETWARIVVGGVSLLVVLAFVGIIALQKRGILTILLASLGRARFLRAFAEHHRAQATRIDVGVHEFYSHNRRGFFAALFFHLIEKAHGVVELWLIFHMLGMEVPWGTCFFVFSVVTTLDNVLFFLQLGGMETWMSTLLSWLALTRDSLHITAALFRRVRFLFWALVGLLLIPVTRRAFLHGLPRSSPTPVPASSNS